MSMGTDKLYLKGEHLTVLTFQTYPAMDIKRNESGHIIEMTGFAMEVFNWIVQNMHLTYTLIQDEVLNFEEVKINGTRRMGSTNYLAEKKADVAVGGMVMSASVYRIVDVARLHSSVLGCMIPAPKPTTYLGATWLPFTYLVWVVLLVSVIVLSCLLYSFGRMELKLLNPKSIRKRGNFDFYNAVDYTFRTLISQGTSCSSRMFAFRVMAGTWALGSFLLVNYYNSIWTSFFTSPNYQPLINSVDELPKNPGIKVTANAISSPVFFFSDAEQGIDKYIKYMWEGNREFSM